MATETWRGKNDRAIKGRESLSEQSEYRDIGCGEGCVRSLECPFARCRFDDPVSWRRTERKVRDKEVMRVRVKESLTVDVLAARFGISRRTVHRILADARKAATATPDSWTGRSKKATT
jgi:AraC-like DNA-binding protein